MQFNFELYSNFGTNPHFRSQNTEISRFYRCLLAVLEFYSAVNALKTQTIKLACTLTRRTL